MEIISGDKFKALQNERTIYRSMDELYEKKPLPNKPFVLISHGGDTNPSEYMYVLDNPHLIHWFATNANIEDTRITAIPVGVNYVHNLEQTEVLKAVLNTEIKKEKDISTAYFSRHTWVNERQRCYDAMKKNGLFMDVLKPYIDYLIELKRSRFVLCPIGNGVDTFRIWEALYMGCVPIIVEYINDEKVRLSHYDSELYDYLPGVVIDSWEKFNREDFTEKKYTFVMENSRTEKLDFNYWKRLIKSK